MSRVLNVPLHCRIVFSNVVFAVFYPFLFYFYFSFFVFILFSYVIIFSIFNS